MWNKTNVFILIAILLSAAAGLTFYIKQALPKTGYIIMQDVYNGFEMKNQIKNEISTIENILKNRMDSMAVELRDLSQEIDGQREKNTSIKEHYLKRKKSYEEEFESRKKDYDRQILTRLNQYINDYGKANHFDYIFGSDGNGSLIYGKESLNITKEMIIYVNRKYKGL